MTQYAQCLSCVQLFVTLWTVALCPWDFPGRNTGVGCHLLVQGIFPTQGSNPGLPHCRRILYRLSHQESPRILEWVAYSSSRRSSQPRNRTRASYVSWIVKQILHHWATRADKQNCPQLRNTSLPPLIPVHSCVSFINCIFQLICFHWKIISLPYWGGLCHTWTKPYVFISLAASSLSCSTWDTSLWSQPL